ncbi:tRNA-specific 2-thiouridylase [Mycoplasma sp. (ex Biomphalaria glabrata)]|uniref:tRNA 2-thiouridine(34) synthase MnmA n=1 Tax=Mycoplasma sp. (ex Biomphalaria glabrata) TaxID=1749074 RepID=UPI00073A80E3|nr:tRNA-specific 2-thiouridylase [Mycoplasma sp. (ex Biomphalaria glabrata)]
MKLKKVIVGLSGGVDSSVAAMLLIQAGYNVEGLFMRNWDSIVNNDILGNSHLDDFVCPQEEDYRYAQLVAEKLNIKLHRVDFVKEYWNEVFQYFIHEYKKGRTPNPDVLCNKYIKFNHFAHYAFNNLQADYIAMGHYAKTIHEDGRTYLVKPKDANKDQTYFLAGLSEEQICRCLFPLANYHKQEVRVLAKEYQLPTAFRKDSTGVCFIGERDFSKFLKNYVPSQPGSIVDIETNEIVGQHEGVMYYTIGQRKGLGLHGNASAYFVVGKKIEEKILYVAKGTFNKYLKSDAVLLENVSLINHRKLEKMRVEVKFRYRQATIPATIHFLEHHHAKVTYDKSYSVTPGQFCVFYDDDRCLGTGIIAKVYSQDKELTYL